MSSIAFTSSDLRIGHHLAPWGSLTQKQTFITNLNLRLKITALSPVLCSVNILETLVTRDYLLAPLLKHGHGSIEPKGKLETLLWIEDLLPDWVYVYKPSAVS